MTTTMSFDPTKQAGLHLSVLRPANGTDCTNEGLSSTVAALTLVAVIDERKFNNRREDSAPEAVPAVAQVSLPSLTAPAVLLRIRLFGSTRPTFSIEPAAALPHQSWYMAGGNYAVTTDSRFTQLLEGMYGAVAIHDRQE
jgi:hypothetical protein